VHLLWGPYDQANLAITFRANLAITTAEKRIFIIGNESTSINGSDEIMLTHLAD
jgi:hypothetical protein